MFYCDHCKNKFESSMFLHHSNVQSDRKLFHSSEEGNCSGCVGTRGGDWLCPKCYFDFSPYDPDHEFSDADEEQAEAEGKAVKALYDRKLKWPRVLRGAKRDQLMS